MTFDHHQPDDHRTVNTWIDDDGSAGAECSCGVWVDGLVDLNEAIAGLHQVGHPPASRPVWIAALYLIAANAVTAWVILTTAGRMWLAPFAISLGAAAVTLLLHARYRRHLADYEARQARLGGSR